MIQSLMKVEYKDKILNQVDETVIGNELIIIH
jgi:hypothetical protein